MATTGPARQVQITTIPPVNPAVVPPRSQYYANPNPAFAPPQQLQLSDQKEPPLEPNNAEMVREASYSASDHAIPVDNHPHSESECFNKEAGHKEFHKVEQQSLAKTDSRRPNSPYGYFSISWVAFTALYWTLCVLVPSFMDNDLTNPHFYMWILAAIAFLAVAFTVYEGYYPDGRVENDLLALDGIGRWSAFLLVICGTVDFFMLTWFLLDDNDQGDTKRGGVGNMSKVWEKALLARGIFHSISAFMVSGMFYVRFRSVCGRVADITFFSEWLDTLLSGVVILLLHNSIIDDLDTETENGFELNTNSSCFSKTFCQIYYSFFVVQVVGWLFPMFLFTSWGVSENAKTASIHVVVLDLCTDLPLVVAVLTEEAYRFHPILFFDVFFKICLVIRAVAYNLVYYIWTNGGQASRFSRVPRVAPAKA